MQAQALVMAAKESPALHNQYEVHKRYYEALRIQDIEKVLPNPKGPNAIPPQKPVKVQEAEVKAQAMIQGKQIQAKSLSDKLQLEIAKLMQDAETKKAEVAKLEAETLYLLEQADGVSDGHQIAMMEMQLGHAKMQQDGIMNSVKLMQSLQKQQMEEQQMKQESTQPKE
jgi:hypothetical protein